MNRVESMRAILNRLELVREFNNNQPEIEDTPAAPSLIDLYSPRVLASYNLNWDYDYGLLEIALYRNSLNQPNGIKIPNFTAPQLPVNFPPVHNLIPRQPKYTSLLPLLITAQSAKGNIRDYHIVSERNSFLKIAMNKKQYEVTDDEPSQLTEITDLHISQTADRQFQIETLERLYQTLRFLQENVHENHAYLLIRRCDQATQENRVCLYEVVNRQDQDNLLFITT
jgi:hypothetical protein